MAYKQNIKSSLNEFKLTTCIKIKSLNLGNKLKKIHITSIKNIFKSKYL